MGEANETIHPNVNLGEFAELVSGAFKTDADALWAILQVLAHLDARLVDAQTFIYQLGGQADFVQADEVGLCSCVYHHYTPAVVRWLKERCGLDKCSPEFLQYDTTVRPFYNLSENSGVEN